MWRVVENSGTALVADTRSAASFKCSLDVAKRVAELANKHHWGRFQIRLAIQMLTDREIPANASKVISKNKAKKYFSSYQKSLDNLAKDLGAVYVPGPRGGKDAAKYVLP